MRIDSHQHYWKIDRGDYHWMGPEQPTLFRDYLPADLRPILQQHGIQKTILVQAAPTVAETDFLLKLAEGEDTVVGVVGWLDLDSASFPRQFKEHRKSAKFVGLRPMIQDLPDDRWILRPRVLDSLRILAEADFPFEFLVHPRHLPVVVQVLELVANLRAVVDHIAKPHIRTGELEPWRSGMAAIAENRNIYCKLSGMITEADHNHWTADDIRPYADHIIEHFGIDRLMFGSDWPVCLQAGSYRQVLTLARELLAPVMNDAAERKIFGENASKFYKLDSGEKPWIGK